MRTTKPISTISFNTKEYLVQKLRELTKAKRLSFWAVIEHKPEDDEGGKKTHYHVYAEPSKMLQTDDLREELREFDPEKPDKPKGCLSWNGSKFDAWYLYALHDKRYLASKGQSRRYHYAHDDFITSDDDDLLCKSRSIDMLSLSPYADILDAQAHGVSWNEYFRRGTVPLPQIALYERAWFALLQEGTDRNGKEGHANDLAPDPVPDPDTHGRIVDKQTGEMFEVDDFKPIL